MTAPDSRVTVGHNDDGTLDEVVGTGDFHLEQMDTNAWWMQLGPHMVWLRARGKITAHFGENEALARGPQQAGGEDAWSALETWLGTFADSIPAQAYHELCAIQRTIAADKAFLRGVIDSGRQQQAELLQRAETAEAALREAGRDAERYRWLRNQLDGVDFAYGEPARTVLTFAWPDGGRVGANLDKNIDAELRLVRDGDSGEG